MTTRGLGRTTTCPMPVAAKTATRAGVTYVPARASSAPAGSSSPARRTPVPALGRAGRSRPRPCPGRSTPPAPRRRRRPAAARRRPPRSRCPGSAAPAASSTRARSPTTLSRTARPARPACGRRRMSSQRAAYPSIAAWSKAGNGVRRDDVLGEHVAVRLGQVEVERRQRAQPAQHAAQVVGERRQLVRRPPPRRPSRSCTGSSGPRRPRRTRPASRGTPAPRSSRWRRSARRPAGSPAASRCRSGCRGRRSRAPACPRRAAAPSRRSAGSRRRCPAWCAGSRRRSGPAARSGRAPRGCSAPPPARGFSTSPVTRRPRRRRSSSASAGSTEAMPYRLVSSGGDLDEGQHDAAGAGLQVEHRRQQRLGRLDELVAEQHRERLVADVRLGVRRPRARARAARPAGRCRSRPARWAGGPRPAARGRPSPPAAPPGRAGGRSGRPSRSCRGR